MKKRRHYIGKNHLIGQGLGYVDVHLLASTLLTGVPLWTLDKKLAQAADKLHMNYVKKRR